MALLKTSDNTIIGGTEAGIAGFCLGTWTLVLYCICLYHVSYNLYQIAVIINENTHSTFYQLMGNYRIALEMQFIHRQKQRRERDWAGEIDEEKSIVRMNRSSIIFLHILQITQQPVRQSVSIFLSQAKSCLMFLSQVKLNSNKVGWREPSYPVIMKWNCCYVCSIQYINCCAAIELVMLSCYCLLLIIIQRFQVKDTLLFFLKLFLFSYTIIQCYSVVSFVTVVERKISTLSAYQQNNIWY